jgi:hypothetical protein
MVSRHAKCGIPESQSRSSARKVGAMHLNRCWSQARCSVRYPVVSARPGGEIRLTRTAWPRGLASQLNQVRIGRRQNHVLAPPRQQAHRPSGNAAAKAPARQGGPR